MARILVVAVLLSLAGIVLIVGFVHMLDPVGSKMADDNDPFGPPDPWWYGLFYLVVGGALLLLAGVALGPLIVGSRPSGALPNSPDNPRPSA